MTSIGECAFQDCFYLSSINIPESVTYIGHSAFSNCERLKSIELPESITEIEYHTFSQCYGLESVVIPNSITTIGSGAFEYCNLKSVYYNSEDPIEADSDVFRCILNQTYDNANLYVPEAAIEKCRKIDPWKNFHNIQTYDFSGIKIISSDVDESTPINIYWFNGIKKAESLDNLTPGIYIIKQGTKMKKIVIR